MLFLARDSNDSMNNNNQSSLEITPDKLKSNARLTTKAITKTPSSSSSKATSAASKSTKSNTSNSASKAGKSKKGSGKDSGNKLDNDFKYLQDKYKIYLDFSKPFQHIRGYQFFAIERAVNDKVIKSSWTWDSWAERKMVTAMVKNAGGYLNRGPNANNYNSKGSISSAQNAKGSTTQNPYDGLDSKYQMPAVKKAAQRWKKLLEREMSKDLKTRASEEALEKFSQNLSEKLLTPPLRLWASDDSNSNSSISKSTSIMALDPGYKNGTKIAIISGNGDVSHTDTLYLVDCRKSNNLPSSGATLDSNEIEKLQNLLLQYKPTVVGVGNGHGSAEIQTAVKKSVATTSVGPTNSNSGSSSIVIPHFLDVDETGASVYSTTELAGAELPQLPNVLRSAVSLARRLLDPLSELCKIPPSSLGVGQYQHSLQPKQLEIQANECFKNCIAKVGVDLATCSAEILQHVPGLGQEKARRIVEYRSQQSTKEPATKRRKLDLDDKFVNIVNADSSSQKLNETCCFRCKQDLKRVKGIGERVFEECAGFLYISDALDIVDRTPHIHPEQVAMVQQLQKDFGSDKLSGFLKLKTSDLTDRNLQPYIKSKVDSKEDLFDLDTLKQLCMQLIPPDSQAGSGSESRGQAGIDIRSAEPKPVFTKLTPTLARESMAQKHKFGLSGSSRGSDIKTIDSLSVGDTLSNGQVRNITDFAAFIDVGLGTDAFLHVSKWRGRSMQVNEKVDVKVVEVRQVTKDKWRLSVELK